MIDVKGLQKNYGGLQVLKGVDLTINKGDCVVLVGPSGCGKSTFLRCLNRLEEPDGGHVIFNGKEVTDHDIDHVRQKMGMVFQHFNLFPHLTVKKNITLDTRFEAEEAHGYVDFDKLDKILHNLLSNAMKYTPENRRITVDVRVVNEAEHRILVLKVEDEGVGISEKELEQIFIRFYNSKKNRGIESNGIGLSLRFDNLASWPYHRGKRFRTRFLFHCKAAY